MDPAVPLYILDAPWISLGPDFLLELLLEGGVLGICRVGSKGFLAAGRLIYGFIASQEKL